MKSQTPSSLRETEEKNETYKSFNTTTFFEQNLDDPVALLDQLRTFTEKDKMMNMRDFNGQKIDPKKTGTSDIASFIAKFEVQRKANDNKCASTKKKKTGPDEETDVRVLGRFYETLHHKFYHYYRNTHPERRPISSQIAILSIIVDDLALTCFR